NDTSVANAIVLFPNPVEGTMFTISGASNDATYRILNVLGQEVAKGKLSNGEISIPNLNAGTYLAEVSSDGQTTIKRFIKK
ncbi:MAG: T9SS type A sorting domain-containing protein, partial [Flavobacterium sp.]|nr:T9SS type A sorting domain-containing protein [Flavobacterium sp.]